MEKIPSVEVYSSALDETATKTNASNLSVKAPYAKNGKFYVRLIDGHFQNIRRLISWPLISLFFGLVWVQIDGQAWLMFSFAKHQITLFGFSLSWHDLPLLAGFMIAGASLLFFMAVAFGRVWCGFACPQSIWTWLFIRIENTIEGRENAREKADNDALSARWLARRTTKHIAWIGLSFITAITFTGYFIPIRELIENIYLLNLSSSTSAWIIIMAALTYTNAGLVREKICLHACPYSRFQGVMFDKDTRTISYDSARGEPRSHKRTALENSGDCIDCGICVQVCPTGIDIRDGLQAACLDCGACIDACDKVMDKLKRPLGLIRFASETELIGEKAKLIRPRLAGYAAVVVCATSVVIYGFTNTTQLSVEIRRDRGALFTQIDKHTTCNNYHIKVESYAKNQSSIDISLTASPNFELIGQTKLDLSNAAPAWRPYRICAKDITASRTIITLKFDSSNLSTHKETTFLAQAF